MLSQADHTVEVEFCVPCDLRPQALAVTKELVDDWSHQLREIRLLPSSGGRFEVSLDGELIFSKLRLDRTPEPGEIDRLIRERIGAPSGAGTEL
ncbi:MAG: Rdx family protein [Candidatus Dormiibacterota bacterium]